MPGRRTRRRGPGAGSTRSTPSSSSSSPSTRCASSSAPTRVFTGSSSKAASSRTSSPSTRAPISTCARSRGTTSTSSPDGSPPAPTAAAVATGCRVEVTPDPTIHEPMKPNGAMAALFERNLGLIGFSVDPDDGEAGYGSTDCGNVSQALPTIHPYIRIAPDGVPGHSREFAEWARSPMARAGLVAGAKALALTALDLLAAPEKLKEAQDEFAGGHHR